MAPERRHRRTTMDEPQHPPPDHRRTDHDPLDQSSCRCSASPSRRWPPFSSEAPSAPLPLPARRPPPAFAPGVFPWVTLPSTCPALSPSGCWFRSPSTSVSGTLGAALAHRGLARGWTTYSTLAVDGLPPRQGRRSGDRARLPRRDGGRGASSWSSPATHSAGAWCRHELLPHSRPGPGRRTGGRCGRSPPPRC